MTTELVDVEGGLTPWELICQHYEFPKHINGRPFDPMPLQIQTINERAPGMQAGLWLDMGTGKTFVSTACMLYQVITGHVDQVIAMMPPTLIAQWARWLVLIKHRRTGRPLSVTQYVGTPKKRMDLDMSSLFILVGFQVLKRDRDRFLSLSSGKKYGVIIDEATAVSNINSDIHQFAFDFCLNMPRALLTGTPANKPMDAYGLIKFTAPGVYRSRRHFENEHVEKYDFFDKPLEYRDLDVLNKNLLINSSRILYKDMYGDLSDPLFDPIEVDLDPAHLKLYRKMADDEMLKLNDEGKIDASKAGRLVHALGQIPANWGHFAQDPRKVSETVLMARQKLDELGGRKLVIFAHYRMTIRTLLAVLEEYGIVAINSEISNKEKDLNKQRFIEDPACRTIAIQYVAGGMGLDGLQYASHSMYAIEPTQQPRDFHQAVARLQRKGQTERVHVMMPVAKGTVHRQRFKDLVNNDEISAQVVRNPYTLRKMIYGEE